MRYIEFGESTVRHRIGCTGAGSHRTIERLCERIDGTAARRSRLRGIRKHGMVLAQVTRYLGP
jgi:hypothetical protein